MCEREREGDEYNVFGIENRILFKFHDTLPLFDQADKLEGDEEQRERANDANKWNLQADDYSNRELMKI